MTLEKALQILIGNQEDKKAESFLKFLSDKLWDQYKEHIMDKVKERGKQLGTLLEDIKAKHKSVGDVRYIGLFSCVELTKDKATHEPLVPFGKDPEGIMGKIVGMLKAKGFNTYSHEACIFVCPPLIITEEELAENMAILDEVLTEVDKMV